MPFIIAYRTLGYEGEVPPHVWSFLEARGRMCEGGELLCWRVTLAVVARGFSDRGVLFPHGHEWVLRRGGLARVKGCAAVCRLLAMLSGRSPGVLLLI